LAGVKRLLFVCLGNICRSPLAENVFRHLIEDAGREDEFEIDSAGTGSWHVGERPDGRAASVAHNLQELVRMASKAGATARIQLLRDYDPQPDGNDVPDPYYGGARGFEGVFDIVARSCRSLLASLPKES
jgi:protein-tyrosine phosphatase